MHRAPRGPIETGTGGRDAGSGSIPGISGTLGTGGTSTGTGRRDEGSRNIPGDQRHPGDRREVPRGLELPVAGSLRCEAAPGAPARRSCR